MAVRFGRHFAELEIAAFAVTPLLLGGWWWARGERLATLLPLLLAPLAAAVVRSARRDRGAALNATLARAAGLQAGYGVLFITGLVLG